jgi:hypothetical protein
VKADADEERAIAFLVYEPHRLGGDLTVGLILIGPVGRQPARPRQRASREVAAFALLSPRCALVELDVRP